MLGVNEKLDRFREEVDQKIVGFDTSVMPIKARLTLGPDGMNRSKEPHAKDPREHESGRWQSWVTY